MTTVDQTKVTIIEDINKLYKLATGKNISVKTFDTLYDMNNDDLEFHLVLLDLGHKLVNAL